MKPAIWKGNNQILRGRLTTVANHLLCGMIRQVRDVCFLELPCCQVGTWRSCPQWSMCPSSLVWLVLVSRNRRFSWAWRQGWALDFRAVIGILNLEHTVDIAPWYPKLKPSIFLHGRNWWTTYFSCTDWESSESNWHINFQVDVSGSRSLLYWHLKMLTILQWTPGCCQPCSCQIKIETIHKIYL